MISQDSLKQTPLYQKHIGLHARMVGFGGWDMPLQYEGIIVEYESTRKQVTVFDTSHMGEFILKGDCRACGLDRLVSSRIIDMPVQSCRYGMILNASGGVMDDLIVYRLGQEEWMIVVNAATTEKDFNHFRSHLTKQSVLNNVSASTGKLDIQGPWAMEFLKDFIPGLTKLDYYTFAHFMILGERAIVSRTGYTGELGYEIYFPANRIAQLWDKIFENPKVKPAGLGARDLLRIEMGYSLYGHELSDVITPLEAGLSKFVDFEKEFIGKEVLLTLRKEGPSRKMAYFVCDSRRAPRSDFRIYSTDSEEIGIVTSGTFSPELKKGIGMGFVANEYVSPGKKILIGDATNKIEACTTSRPFYKKSSLKN